MSAVRGESAAAGAIDDLSCWVLSDGKAGTENQCIGLAEAIGCRFDVKRISPRTPWRRLPTGIWMRLVNDRPNRFLSRDGDRLAAPWPDLLIASGRASVAYTVAIRRAGCGRTFAVQVQNPCVPPCLFDLVIPPRHDRVAGANVISTLGALNRVTPTRLEEAAGRFESMVEHLPRPRVAVLIGGSNRAYGLRKADMRRLSDGLVQLMDKAGAGLMLTPSRRTGADNIARLRAAVCDRHAVMWDGTGDNPYFGFLGLADAIVVTADSVSMTSEACATGKPVYVAKLSGGNAKFRRFHTTLEEQGYTRPFTGDLAGGPGKRLSETSAVAEQVRRRLAGTVR